MKEIKIPSIEYVTKEELISLYQLNEPDIGFFESRKLNPLDFVSFGLISSCTTIAYDRIDYEFVLMLKPDNSFIVTSFNTRYNSPAELLQPNDFIPLSKNITCAAIDGAFQENVICYYTIPKSYLCTLFYPEYQSFLAISPDLTLAITTAEILGESEVCSNDQSLITTYNIPTIKSIEKQYGIELGLNFDILSSYQ